MKELNQYAQLVDPEMKEIVDSFIVETKEILEKLDVDLMNLEKKPDDKDLLNTIFRHFHTIKGTSSFLALDKLTTVTHRCEDILNKLRKGEAILNSQIMDSILSAFDKIKSLLICIEINQNEDINVTDIIDELTELIKNLESGNIPTKESTTKKKKATQKEKKIESNTEPLEEPEAVSTVDNTTENLSVPVQTIDEDKLKSDNAKKSDNSIRVDIQRLDDLLNIVSELVLGRNRLNQVNSEVALEQEGTKLARDLSDVTKLIDLMTNELQLVVMKTRMVKIGKVFNKFPRLVRDLSKESNKEIQLEIYGEETELDKTLIEEINDPLMHLIRNSIDHGIELPEVRLNKGKNSQGKIILSAQHEGNNIIITIEDDGKGIDPEVIKEKAISKGMLSPEKAKELSRQDILNLIFLPGFSTAEVVTNISGRGVGMDVVKTNVAKLRGIITIDSNPGKGTKIIIKLPLTLAIIQGMIVKLTNQLLVIPLNSVLEVLRVHKENIATVNQKPVIRMRDSVLPLINVEEIMFGKKNEDNKKVWQYVVVVGIAEKSYGIEVEGLVGQKEVVIKSLGNYFGKIPGVAGSTIMGDGSVVMIADLNELVNHTLK
ncbi:MAG: chemotaxis protein CheA [Ignavibacteriaceae bacterium]|nr:chemotaxis protein CheA [Ignavibacteriaceae bacterium]